MKNKSERRETLKARVSRREERRCGHPATGAAVMAVIAADHRRRHTRVLHLEVKGLAARGGSGGDGGDHFNYLEPIHARVRVLRFEIK